MSNINTQRYILLQQAPRCLFSLPTATGSSLFPCSICSLPFSISVLVILLDQTIHDPRFSLPQVPINLSSSLSALEVRASLFWLVDDSSLFQISSFSLLFLILILLPDLSLLVTKYSLLLRLHALTLFMTLYYDFRKTHGTRAVQTTDAIKQMT